MHKIFQNLVFCNAFNLNNGKKLWSTSIFKFERKVHIWDTLIYIYCLFEDINTQSFLQSMLNLFHRSTIYSLIGPGQHLSIVVTHRKIFKENGLMEITQKTLELYCNSHFLLFGGKSKMQTSRNLIFVQSKFSKRFKTGENKVLISQNTFEKFKI